MRLADRAVLTCGKVQVNLKRRISAGFANAASADGIAVVCGVAVGHVAFAVARKSAVGSAALSALAVVGHTARRLVKAIAVVTAV